MNGLFLLIFRVKHSQTVLQGMDSMLKGDRCYYYWCRFRGKWNQSEVQMVQMTVPGSGVLEPSWETDWGWEEGKKWKWRKVRRRKNMSWSFSHFSHSRKKAQEPETWRMPATVRWILGENIKSEERKTENRKPKFVAQFLLHRRIYFQNKGSYFSGVSLSLLWISMWVLYVKELKAKSRMDILTFKLLSFLKGSSYSFVISSCHNSF